MFLNVNLLGFMVCKELFVPSSPMSINALFGGHPIWWLFEVLRFYLVLNFSLTIADSAICLSSKVNCLCKVSLRGFHHDLEPIWI
jgi:hypothetical protein